MRQNRAPVAACGVLLWAVACVCLGVDGTRLVAAQQALPLLTAPVNDFARVIDQQTAQELDRRIRALQRATGDVIVVATVESLQPYGSIEEYAVRMFENGGRGIGEKGKHNGALVLLALQERQVRIEVGYDLEEFITDGYAGETIRQLMTPEFRMGNYGPGLLAGTTRLINRVAERRGVRLDEVPSGRQPVQPPGTLRLWPIVLLAVWLLVMMASNRRRRRPRRRYWGGHSWSGWNSGVGPFGGGGFGGGFGGFGGGGGGGFGGFGGGLSGGGGASGRW